MKRVLLLLSLLVACYSGRTLDQTENRRVYPYPMAQIYELTMSLLTEEGLTITQIKPKRIDAVTRTRQQRITVFFSENTRGTVVEVYGASQGRSYREWDRGKGPRSLMRRILYQLDRRVGR